MLVRQNSSKVVICCMDMLALCDSVVSCCSFCLTICMDGATGTEVKRALTSKEVMTSPGSSILPCSYWITCCVFLSRWGDWPTKGLMMWASSLATP